MLTKVADFLRWIDGLGPTTFHWRGQGNADWRLTSSIGREGAAGIDTIEELRCWIRAVEQFAEPRPQNHLEWLVLAQHYGVPTPLLDWSANPLFALFFAASVEPTADGAVFALKDDAFPMTTSVDGPSLFGPINQEGCAIIRTTAMNRRTVAQKSVMTLQWPNNIDLKSHTPKERLHVFLLPKEDKEATCRALSILGVNQTAMMGDIITAVQAYKEQLIPLEKVSLEQFFE